MKSSKSILSPSILLLCDESLGSSDCEDEEVLVDDSGDDDDYIQTLLDKEISNGGPQMPEFFQSSWIQRARSEGIHYILRVCFATHSVCGCVCFHVLDDE